MFFVKIPIDDGSLHWLESQQASICATLISNTICCRSVLLMLLSLAYRFCLIAFFVPPFVAAATSFACAQRNLAHSYKRFSFAALVLTVQFGIYPRNWRRSEKKDDGMQMRWQTVIFYPQGGLSHHTLKRSQFFAFVFGGWCHAGPNSRDCSCRKQWHTPKFESLFSICCRSSQCSRWKN